MYAVLYNYQEERLRPPPRSQKKSLKQKVKELNEEKVLLEKSKNAHEQGNKNLNMETKSLEEDKQTLETGKTQKLADI